MWNKVLDEIRSNMEHLKTKGIPIGVMMTKEKVNGVNCEVIKPDRPSGNEVVLYFHGGGFCLGIYDTNREFVAQIAKRLNREIYLPDYRLAPENPYPAALDDAEAIYLGLLERGYQSDQIIIMGDSSGCALAASTLIKLKNNGVNMPKALTFITPVFDFSGLGESVITRSKKDPFKLKDPLAIARNYFGSNDTHLPMISPLYGNLEGFPPTLLHAGDYDVFLSDSCRLKEKLEIAGVRVNLKVWSKMWHIFLMQASLVPEANRSLEEICQYVMDEFEI
jgi:Esterase/lipase